MLHYNSLRRYTLGLLSTFNDLEIEYPLSDGTTQSKKIPLKFATREKATLFDEHTTKQLLSGNYNVLPRASLVLTSMIKSEIRATNKFTKHNIKEDDDDASYNYNAVPYEYMYEIVVQCRGMNEASMIIEQIAPRFNPNYTMRINEIPNSTEATSVPIQLLDVSIESEEYDEITTNVVTVSMGISIKGNLYPPLQTMAKVKNLKIFNNLWADDEFQRASLLEWDVIDSVVTPPPTLTIFSPMGENAPVILGIEVHDTDIENGDEVLLTVKFSDPDNKYGDYDGWTFIWNVVQGSGTVTTGTETVTLFVTDISTNPIFVQVMIVDVHGNQSTPFITQIDANLSDGLEEETGNTLLTQQSEYILTET